MSTRGTWLPPLASLSYLPRTGHTPNHKQRWKALLAKFLVSLPGCPGETWVSPQRVAVSPVDDVVAQVSLEQQTPALDGVEQGLLEGAAVTLQPAVENLGVLTPGHLLVQFLVRVDLPNTGRGLQSALVVLTLRASAAFCLTLKGSQVAQGANTTQLPVCPCASIPGCLLLHPYKRTVRQRETGLGDNSRPSGASGDSRRMPLSSWKWLPTLGHPIPVRWLPFTCKGGSSLTQFGDLQVLSHCLDSRCSDTWALLTLEADSWTANPLPRASLSVGLLLGSHRVLRSGSAVPCPSHTRQNTSQLSTGPSPS